MAPCNNKPFYFSLLWLGFFAWSAVSTACYFPDGIQATDNTPCNKSASVSVCCGPGFTCLSNGLCQQGQNIFRGTCTDSEWKSDKCPKFCTSGSQLDNWMSSCPGLGSGYFCCGTDNSCCNNSTLVLDIGPGAVVSTASSTSTFTSTSTATSVSTTHTSTSGTTTTISTQSATNISSDQAKSASITPTGTQVDDKHGSGTNVAVAAGIGVGVGLPACAAIAILIFFFCRRRQRRPVASEKAASDPKPKESPLRELESNVPRSEMGSSELYELPAPR